VKLLKSKDEACAALKALIERAEVETGERVNYFRSDGGGEYGSKETPQENGVAERMNRTIVEMARTLLQDAGLTNTYLKQRVTPFEAYTGNKPSIAHLRIFGCKAYAGLFRTQKGLYARSSIEWAPCGVSGCPF